MGNFINGDVISVIMDEYSDVKEIIKTTMRVSPFGPIGEKTYVVEYVNITNETKYVVIGEKQYNEIYTKLYGKK